MMDDFPFPFQIFFFKETKRKLEPDDPMTFFGVFSISYSMQYYLFR